MAAADSTFNASPARDSSVHFDSVVDKPTPTFPAQRKDVCTLTSGLCRTRASMRSSASKKAMSSSEGRGGNPPAAR
jgi:hypothetical protein